MSTEWASKHVTIWRGRAFWLPHLLDPASCSCMGTTSTFARARAFHPFYFFIHSFFHPQYIQIAQPSSSSSLLPSLPPSLPSFSISSFPPSFPPYTLSSSSTSSPSTDIIYIFRLLLILSLFLRPPVLPPSSALLLFLLFLFLFLFLPIKRCLYSYCSSGSLKPTLSIITSFLKHHIFGKLPLSLRARP